LLARLERDLAEPEIEAKTAGDRASG
jgi:hypothetical protein